MLVGGVSVNTRRVAIGRVDIDTVVPIPVSDPHTIPFPINQRCRRQGAGILSTLLHSNAQACLLKEKSECNLDLPSLLLRYVLYMICLYEYLLRSGKQVVPYTTTARSCIKREEFVMSMALLSIALLCPLESLNHAF